MMFYHKIYNALRCSNTSCCFPSRQGYFENFLRIFFVMIKLLVVFDFYFARFTFKISHSVMTVRLMMVLQLIFYKYRFVLLFFIVCLVRFSILLIMLLII